MSRFFYYIYIALLVALGLPVVAVIISVIWLQSKWHLLTCKIVENE